MLGAERLTDNWGWYLLRETWEPESARSLEHPISPVERLSLGAEGLMAPGANDFSPSPRVASRTPKSQALLQPQGGGLWSVVAQGLGLWLKRRLWVQVWTV